MTSPTSATPSHVTGTSRNRTTSTCCTCPANWPCNSVKRPWQSFRACNCRVPLRVFGCTMQELRPREFDNPLQSNHDALLLPPISVSIRDGTSQSHQHGPTWCALDLSVISRRVVLDGFADVHPDTASSLRVCLVVSFSPVSAVNESIK